MQSLSIDCGGTRIKMAVVEAGRILAQTSFDANADKGLQPVLDKLPGIINELCGRSNIATAQLRGIGFTFPGGVDTRRCRALSTPAGKYDDALELDLPRWAESTCGLPVVMENDTNAALLGEWHFGAGKGCSNFVMMTLGTGIGTSALIEGRPLRGVHFQAGFPGGHFVVKLDGKPCNCGNFGCAETEASTWALPEIITSDPLFENSGFSKGVPLDYKSVFELARKGDKLAGQIKERSIKVWAAVLMNLTHAFDPEMIVLGGGIMRSSDQILPALQKAAAANGWSNWGTVQVRKAAHPETAGLLGMHYALQQKLENAGTA